MSPSKRRQLDNAYISIYLCPSVGKWQEREGEGYRRDYFGCFGGRGHSLSSDPLNVPLYGQAGIVADDGIMYVNSGTRFTEIEDGSSNTFIAGESFFGLLLGDGPGYGECLGGPAVWYFGGAAKPNDLTSISYGRPLRGTKNPINTDMGCLEWDENNEIPFGSEHPGGCQMVFADGHVQFLVEEIDFDLYQAMSTRAGGEVAGSN